MKADFNRGGRPQIDSYQRARIETYLHEHAADFDLQPNGDLSVTHLGDGESYRAWVVHSPADPNLDALVFRVLRRPVDQLPQPMAEEFAALKLIPAGLGPRGVLLEQDSTVLGAPFMIESLVPGVIVPRQAWTPMLFRAHAQQLATLHSKTFDTHGPVTTPNRTSPLSMVDNVEAALDWWSGAHPEITQLPQVQRAVEKVRRIVTDAEPVFNRVESFALVHGDLVVPNILIGDDGRPRYVDWEWAEIGDPARDLAYVGGRIGADPWYAPMTDAEIGRFTADYAEAAGLRGASQLAALRVRRDAWELFERLLSSMHWRLMTTRVADPASTPYPAAAAEMTRGLEQWPETR